MKIDLEAADLEPLIDAIVTRVLQSISDDRAQLSDGRLAMTEAEAAAALGIAKHVLRDARLRGEVAGRLVGRTMLYDLSELRRFLSTQNQSPVEV